MGYYIDQLAEQDRQKKLADLLAMQQDNIEPGVKFDTGVPQPVPQQTTIADLLKSGADRDQINAMLSQSTMTSPGFNAPAPNAGSPTCLRRNFLSTQSGTTIPDECSRLPTFTVIQANRNLPDRKSVV